MPKFVLFLKMPVPPQDYENSCEAETKCAAAEFLRDPALLEFDEGIILPTLNKCPNEAGTLYLDE